MQFVGTEIKKGEKVPAERIIEVKLGAAKRQFRRLREGQAITEGQLLIQLDDRVARSDMTIKEAKAKRRQG